MRPAHASQGSTTELHLHLGLFRGSSHALHPALLMAPDQALTTSEACRWCLLARVIISDNRERCAVDGGKENGFR